MSPLFRALLFTAGATTFGVILPGASAQGTGSASSAAKPAQSPASGKPGSAPAVSSIPVLNRQLVLFCKNRLGGTVGSGECTALIEEAYAAVGARRFMKQFPSSQDYVWGTPICALEAANGRQLLDVSDAGRKPEGKPGADVKPGDVMQLRDAVFRAPLPRGVYAIYPHHTSVIEKISDDGRTCTVLEQNVGGHVFVIRTNLNLSELVSGWIRLYRPVSINP